MAYGLHDITNVKISCKAMFNDNSLDLQQQVMFLHLTVEGAHSGLVLAGPFYLSVFYPGNIGLTLAFWV